MATEGCMIEIQHVGFRTDKHMLPGDCSAAPGYEMAGRISNLPESAKRRFSSDTPLVTSFCAAVTAKPGARNPRVRRTFSERQDNDCGGSVAMTDIDSLVELPEGISSCVAASLSYRGLLAYKGVRDLEAGCNEMLKNSKTGTILVIGGRGFGLWTISLVRSLLNSYPCELRLVVADATMEGDELDEAVANNGISRMDTLHWRCDMYEADLKAQTRQVVPEGLDGVIDFSGQKRAASRLRDMLNEKAVVVTVGNSRVWTERRRCSVTSIDIEHSRDRPQLEELIQLIKEHKVNPPMMSEGSVHVDEEILEEDEDDSAFAAGASNQ